MSKTRAIRKNRTTARGRAGPGTAVARALRFVKSDEARVFYAPWGKHWFLSEPELTAAAGLMLVRVAMPPGAGHQFHTHPESDEIIYVVDGVAEQWVDRENRRLRAGDSAYIPKGVVHHAPYEAATDVLAILSPAPSKAVHRRLLQREPWRSLRTPLVQRG
jgi:quercetin dioxygenase-like cupin family protein